MGWSPPQSEPSVMKNPIPGELSRSLPRALVGPGPWLLILILSIPLTLSSHPISLSTVVANIETNRVKVEMKILVEDLMLFQDVQPNREQILEAPKLRDASRAHQTFLLDYFNVRTVDGAALSGSVTSTDTEEITDPGIKLDEVMSASVYYELEFPLTTPPDFLTFSQDFGGPGNPLPAIMDLIVLQNSARLGYPVQIGPKNPHSVELDWENPPTNERKSWRQRRELMRQRREELLGITSYTTTYSYLYITDTEIRHEILVPFLNLETWFPIQRANFDFLEVSEQEAARPLVAEYFLNHAPVLIDGVKVPAQVDRVDFYGLDFRDFARRAAKTRVGVHNARAGIILSYGTKTPPSTVKVTWDTFNQHTPLLNSIVFDHQNPGYRHFFTPAEPDFEWAASPSNPGDAPATSLPLPPQQPKLRIPMIASLLAIIGGLGLGYGLLYRSPRTATLALFAGILGIIVWQRPLVQIAIPQTIPEDAVISRDQADQVFAALHGNLYRAFDYRQEEQVYDVLSESVGGDLLESLYLKIRDGLKMEEQGGAIARVGATTIDESAVLARRFLDGKATLDYRCTWRVSGTVEHWGHVHSRENQYQAVFQISDQDDRWKITRLDVENETRLGFQTGLRETK